MNNLLIKYLVEISGAEYFCVSTDWTLKRAVSFIFEKNINACPVTSANWLILKRELNG